MPFILPYLGFNNVKGSTPNNFQDPSFHLNFFFKYRDKYNWLEYPLGFIVRKPRRWRLYLTYNVVFPMKIGLGLGHMWNKLCGFIHYGLLNISFLIIGPCDKFMHSIHLEKHVNMYQCNNYMKMRFEENGVPYCFEFIWGSPVLLSLKVNFVNMKNE
jgi:hypothetical protein